ncbi:MAG: lactonase family protein [Planctomycetota bacterium]|nr:MAG: lactonase family protein [Planctomycetota bacterium]
MRSAITDGTAFGAAVLCAIGLLSVACAALEAAEPAADPMHVYLGTYTRGASKGIYLADLDVATGRLSNLRVAAEATNPSFLALHPKGPFLYAVNEVGEYRGRPGGAVTGFRIRDDGTLAELNHASTQGGAPCHLVVDSAGRFVLVANYSGGSVCVLPISADGRVGEAVSLVQHEGSSVDPARQRGPHAHSINLDATNRFAIAADLGLDKLLVYRFDRATGRLLPNDPPWVSVRPGSGPRHFTFHPNGRWAYVINELASTITALTFDAKTGRLKPFQTVSTVPADFDGANTTAEVRVHPGGRWLYGSNRGHDSIAVFAIDQDSGRLKLIQHHPSGGKTPRNFAPDPSGRWLLVANQNSDNVVVLRVDADTGRLTPTDVELEVADPVCVRFRRAAK